MLVVMLFAIAISVDGFLVGISQGMRGVKIPFSTLVVINIVSAIVVFLSLSIGRHAAYILNPIVARIIGSSILIVMGGFMLMSSSKSLDLKKDRIVHIKGYNYKNNYRPVKTAQRLIEMILMLPKLLIEPNIADLDSSGTLTVNEGFFLGLALAIDALGVGFGAGMAGVSNLFTPIIASITQGIFVSLGLVLGRKMRGTVSSYMLEKLPGGILIFLGVLKLK